MKELEMILAAVAQLGEAGKEAFIWWLVMDKGLSFVAAIALISSIVLVAKAALAARGHTNDLKRIRNTLGIGCAGYLTETEITRIHERIADLLKKD